VDSDLVNLVRAFKATRAGVVSMGRVQGKIAPMLVADPDADM
jgi:hypothetical protein